MKPKARCYDTYVEILNEELLPALGCTEPIALAYCCALARQLLGTLPEKSVVEVSGNIVKNVKSVVVPHTGGLKGICAAAAAGLVAGDADAKLEVIAKVTPQQIEQIKGYLRLKNIEVKPYMTENKLDIRVRVFADEHTACARISKTHTGVSYLEKDGQVLLDKTNEKSAETNTAADRSCLNVRDILYFADTVNLQDVADVLERQIAYNTAISQEGLSGSWGAGIGKLLLQRFPADIKNKAKAAAAAGSDARMSGCELPVVINSGSGNQGMTVSLPVITYAKELNKTHEELLRALVVANLLSVRIKSGMGALSAFCGAVSAGAAAACGIAYLQGGREYEVSHTLVNALAIAGGIVCDGAKPSCAAKIAVSVEAGLIGYEMVMAGTQFYGGDGILRSGVEKSIDSIARLGREGMRDTDIEIIRMMTEE